MLKHLTAFICSDCEETHYLSDTAEKCPICLTKTLSQAAEDLPSGRNLDAEIAVRVFEWTSAEARGAHADEDCLLPRYSTRINDAWTVVNKLNKLGFTVESKSYNAPPLQYICRVSDSATKLDFAYTVGDSIPHAICLAALEALKNKGKRDE